MDGGPLGEEFVFDSKVFVVAGVVWFPKGILRVLCLLIEKSFPWEECVKANLWVRIGAQCSELVKRPVHQSKFKAVSLHLQEDPIKGTALYWFDLGVSTHR